MLKNLDRLRGPQWKDEIPTEVVHSNSQDKFYKARKGWFQSITANAEVLMMKGEIGDDNARAAAEQLVAKFTSREFSQQELTTVEDIALANSLLDIILGRSS